jgi:large subunit ribosomal protein L25
MEMFTLKAETRATGGKGAARSTREAGKTPGVIYRAGRAAEAIRFDASELAAIFRRTDNRNALLDLVVGDGRRTCLIREIQRHPTSRVVEHVDFYEVAEADRVTVPVPLRPVGRAAGTKTGGTLRLVTREIQVRCSPMAIPATIDVDVTALEVGRFIRASQLGHPPGGTLVFQQDFNVVTVEGKKSAVDEAPATTAAAAPAAAAAAPAAGKAAAPAKAAEKKDKK